MKNIVHVLKIDRRDVVTPLPPGQTLSCYVAHVFNYCCFSNNMHFELLHLPSQPVLTASPLLATELDLEGRLT